MKRWNEEGNDAWGKRSSKTKQEKNKARHEEHNFIGQRYQTTTREIESMAILKIKISCFK